MSDSLESSPMPPPALPVSRSVWAQKHGVVPVPTPPTDHCFVVFRDEPGPYQRTAYRVASDEEALAFSVIAIRLLSDDFRHADEDDNFSAMYYDLFGGEWADAFGDVVEIKDRAALHRRLFPALFELCEAVARLAVN